MHGALNDVSLTQALCQTTLHTNPSCLKRQDLLCMSSHVYPPEHASTCDLFQQVNPDPNALQTLTSMGFHLDSAAKALQQCHNKQANAIERLVSWGEAARSLTPSTQPPSTTTEPSSSLESTWPASLGGDCSSSQPVSAASLLAQALQSNPAGRD